nr:MAG TPA: YsxB-like protein [Caudoviricetes sp.]
MITVTISRNAEELIVEVSGHSNYAPQGEDIVCAGVSALTLMCANAAMLSEGKIEKMCSGYSKITLPNSENIRFFCAALVEAFEIMATKYPEYICVNVPAAGG